MSVRGRWFSMLAVGSVVLLCMGYSVRSSAQPAPIVYGANCNYWDVNDFYNGDAGDINDGGQDAYDGWGYLKVRVTDQSATILSDNEELCGFTLTWDGGRRWHTETPVETGFYPYCSGGDRPSLFQDGKPKAMRPHQAHAPSSVLPASSIVVSRELYAPLGTDYIRYIDSFDNTSGAVREVYVAWGGNLGSDDCTTLSGTSSGDYAITNADQWAVTIQQCGVEGRSGRPELFDPAGPAEDPPNGYAFRGAADTTFVGDGEIYDNPVTTPWNGNGDDGLAYVFHFTLQPGQTVRLAYFLYHGIRETEEPPTCGGPPPAGPEAIPAPGSEILKAKNWATAMVANPDFADLDAATRASILNWPGNGFGNSFYDDNARSQFCIDFKTGNYQWNILKGAGMGNSYTGVATVLNGGAKVVSKPGATAALNFTYDILKKKANGYFMSPAGAYSPLVDKLTTNDPPCGPPPPPTRTTR